MYRQSPKPKFKINISIIKIGSKSFAILLNLTENKQFVLFAACVEAGAELDQTRLAAAFAL
jgi:hypothetical protein